MMNNNSFSAAILGATGYTGQEIAALLARHPRIRATFVSSETEAGAPAAGGRLRYMPAAEVPLDAADIVFVCLPHGDAEGWALRGRAEGARVVDLSADLRDGRHGAVYGLPELWRERIRGADLVANPGCYPTGILLGLAPLLAAGQLDRGRPVLIDAASGVTGAGRSAKRDLLYGEVAEDYRAYGVGNSHRHVPEIERGLAAIAGGAVPFVFTPHLLPVRRGILETMYVPVAEGASSVDVHAALRAAYADEPFVEVDDVGLPSLAGVVHRNVVAIGVADVKRVNAPLALCVVALDNLLKGAAGQAVQNANLMLGLPETEGLPW
jgi:N-acetyl-gamma-glutamyl-phosphate reductase